MASKSSLVASGDSSDCSDRLRSLMQAANIPSFRALSRQANVSAWQIRQLRGGHIAQMRVEVLCKVSQALKLSLNQLLASFLDVPAFPSTGHLALHQSAQIDSLQAEYQRLQAQLQSQRDRLWQEFQSASLHRLEPWLTHWPTAAHAAQQNPDIPASRLLPLVRPVEQLMADWGIEAIAPVGAEVTYDPQLHQLMGGSVPPDGRVKIRYTGYRLGDKLLHRARVSPIATSD